MKNKDKVAIIGNFPLVIECAKLIQKNDFEIVCIFSETKFVREWAQGQKITVTETIIQFYNFLENTEIDYLFSIQNPYKISNLIIEKINKLAINYHNSLLPKYGGNEYNVCWMIWNGEKEGGITWHVMSNLMDGGPIVKQLQFNIDSDETAYTLYLKCQEYAKNGLSELLKEAKFGNLSLIPQQLKDRTFFTSNYRGCGFAVVDWYNDAEYIFCLFRALDFTPQPNPITTLKFKFGNNYYSILEMVILNSKSDGVTPGTIIKQVIDNGICKIQVATQSYDMLVGYQQISLSIEGSIPIEEGNVLGKELFEQQKNVSEIIARDDNFWKNELSNFVPSKNFIQKKTIKYTDFSNLYEINFSKLFLDPQPSTIEALTLILGYLFRLNNYSNFSLCVESLNIFDETISNIFLPVKPFNVNFSNGLSFSLMKETCCKLLNQLNSKSLIFGDILHRYPQHKETLLLNSILISFSKVNSKFDSYFPIVFDINQNKQKLSIFVANAYLNDMPLCFRFIEDHFKELVRNWVKTSAEIYSVNLLSTFEKVYLKRNRENSINYPKQIALGGLIDRSCKLHFNKMALESRVKRVTYKDLQLYSDCIARNILSVYEKNHLTSNYVGVYLDKSVDAIITFIAVLKTGLTYIVLDPTYPDRYLKHIIHTSKIDLFIHSKDNIKLKSIVNNINENHKTTFLELSGLFNKSNPEIKLPKNVPSETLAYVLFTSGSTGMPKGVMITHRSVINLVYAFTSRVKVNRNTKTLQFSNIAFDSSVWEIYATLIFGGTLYVPNKVENIAGDNLKEAVIKEKITTLLMTPSALRVQPFFKSSYLKTIIVGGEECPTSLSVQWSAYYRFINAYGPTECTVTTTISDLKPTTEVNIGKPLPNYQVMILDNYHNYMPVGIIGEIAISGDGVAKGYLNNKDLTEKKFKEINCLGNYKRSFLTGDLGSWTNSGELKYHGRNDTLIKIRGFRMNTALIEEVITSFPGVNVCIILANALNSAGEFDTLYAYILLEKGIAAPSLNSMRRFVKERLPDFMVPEKFLIIHELPLTASDKVDRKQLLLEKKLNFLRDEITQVAKTKLQLEIADIWRKVVDFKNEIDIYKSFFELGGNSLQITKIILAIQEKYNIQIPIPEFLKNPHIKFLEDVILNNKNIQTQNMVSLMQEELVNFKRVIDSKKLSPINKKQFGRKKIKKVFLTGLTGFLGSHIAKSFLNMGVEIFCLVRCKDIKLSDKVNKLLKDYGWKENEINKLNLLEGDLSLKYFGLDEKVYYKLASEIDVICNAAAFVNHINNYGQLKGTNLTGVWNCIEFAYTGKSKYFSHVSTLSVLDGLGHYYESFVDVNDIKAINLSGYNTTKLAAEICLNEIRDYLLPKIYRPGWLGGESANGIFNYRDNHLFLFIKGCLQMGFAPDWDVCVEIFPVDYVANYIANSILYDKEWGITYNLIPLIAETKRLKFKDFILYFAKKTNVHIKFIPYKNWQNLLKEVTSENAIFPLIPIYLAGDVNLFFLGKETLPGNHNFLNSYKKLELPSVPALVDLMPIYYNYLSKVSFF